MYPLQEILDKVIEACYSGKQKTVVNEMNFLIDKISTIPELNDNISILLHQINSAMGQNDLTSVADYLFFGFNNIVNNEPVSESIYYPYSELIPKTDEKIFFLKSFLDDELLLCIKKNNTIVKLNSFFSPTNEVNNIIKNLKLKSYVPVVCLFGIGTGLLAEALLNKLSVDSKLIIYEPEHFIINYCRDSGLDLNGSDEEKMVSDRIMRILNDKRVDIYIEDETKSSFQLMLERHIDYSELAGLVSFVHVGYDYLYTKACLNFFNMLKDLRIRVETNKNTEFYFMEDYIRFPFRNIHLCKKLNLISEMRGFIPRDIPTVIVSAGPSLNKNIDELHLVKGHFFIVAVDTAVQYLLKRDIIPDIMITVDPEKPMKYFEDERSFDIPCVFSDNANTELLDRIKGRLFLLDGKREYLELLLNDVGVKTSVPRGFGGSVATAAFAFLIGIGIKNIILIGQDLAYTGDKSHADGFNDESQNEISYVEGIDGNVVRSRSDWLNYLKWFENSMVEINKRELDVQVIDATEGGAKIHGTRIMTLKDAVELFRTENGDLPYYNFEEKIIELPYLFDENGYANLCRRHKSIINNIRDIETNSYEAYKICDQVIDMIKGDNASPHYLHKQNKKIAEIRKIIEKSPVYYIISRYADNFTLHERTRLELEDGDNKNTQINLMEIMKITFDSYVKVSKKVYKIAKEYENTL